MSEFSNSIVTMQLTSAKVFILCTVMWITCSKALYISNLDKFCYKCLCHASTKCNKVIGCEGDYCGPFNISRTYWNDAGYDTEFSLDWKGCANDYECAKKITTKYLAKHARDCNGDGVTDCLDYLMVNVNAPRDCARALDHTEEGRRAMDSYMECKILFF